MANAVWFATALSLLVSFGAGCGHPGDTTTPGTGSAPAGPVGDTHAAGSGSAELKLEQDLPRLAKLSVQLTRDLAAAFTEVGGDCAAATAKLGALATTYREVPIAIGKVLHAHQAKEMRAALAPVQAEYDTAAQAIAASKTLATCASDKAFEDAFDRLEAPP